MSVGAFKSKRNTSQKDGNGVSGSRRGKKRIVNHTVSAHACLELVNLCQCRVLPAGSKEVTERLERDTAVAAFIEEGEGFFVICRRLGNEIALATVPKMETVMGFGPSEYHVDLLTAW